MYHIVNQTLGHGVMYHIIVNQTLGMPWSDVSYYSEPDIGHAME